MIDPETISFVAVWSLTSALGSKPPEHRSSAPSPVSAPLPAPTLQQSWAQVKLQLSAFVHQPKLADNVAELHEWYWDGACEELSDQASVALRANPFVQSNFEALCMFDMDGGSDQSAAEHLLAFGRASQSQIDLLRKLVNARLRIVRVNPCGALGLHKVHDLNSGKVFWVPSEPMIAGLTEPTDYLLRLIVFPGLALLAGPCFTLPAEANDPLRLEAEDLVGNMMHPRLPGCRSTRERGLVDFSHQWAERCLGSVGIPAPIRAPFTILRGA